MMLGAWEAWKHEDFLCRNYILNCLVYSLYNVYCNIGNQTVVGDIKKETQDKRSEFKMVDSKSVKSQV